jgi:hypothetical protein
VVHKYLRTVFDSRTTVYITFVLINDRNISRSVYVFLIVDNTMPLLPSQKPSIVTWACVSRFQLVHYCDESVPQWQIQLNHGSEAN